MVEKDDRGAPRSDRPRIGAAAELKEKRDAFLHTFFKRGAELTDELVRENGRLREQLGELETENAGLKTQLASDQAIRDLLKKIDELERDKARLLSSVYEHQEIANHYTNRVAAIETELESFANMYVASFQLHTTLRVRAVIRNIKELLCQLVGARSLALYFVDEGERRLLPIAAEGVELASLPAVALRDSVTTDPVATIIERTYLTGVPHVARDEAGAAPPAASIPLQLDNHVVGTIVVFTLLAQKKGFIAVDRELFKLLGAHAGGALVAAHLWEQKNGRLPTAEALREMCA